MKSTLNNLREWVDVERTNLPRYLCDYCPINLREGRRQKTKMRLGCHELNCSASRMIKNRTESDKVTTLWL